VRGLGGRYRVLVVDLPGHGDAAGPFTLTRAVERTRAVIDEADEGAHLVGISGGAVVALLAYLNNPTRVSSLVLSGGLAHAPRWVAVQRALALMTPEPLLARMLRGAYSGGSSDHVQAAEEDFRRCGKRTYTAGLAELSKIDVRPRLSQVEVPTLVLCGTKDRANIPLSKELAAGIPSAELRLVAGATHLWNLQQPNQFNETVSAFIDQVTSSRP
jgi:pimeloyl-ACP methyl ester carboxylesterase